MPSETLRAWDAFDLPAALQQATGLPVVVENDGSAAACGELLYGHGREIDDFLYLFIGPALGGGVVLGGNYLPGGRNANAGDLAVVPVGHSTLASAPPARRAADAADRAGLPRRARAPPALARGGGCARRSTSTARSRPRPGPSPSGWRMPPTRWLPVLTGVHILDVDHVVLAGDLSPEHLGRLAARLAAACEARVAESRRAPAILVGAVGRDAGPSAPRACPSTSTTARCANC